MPPAQRRPPSRPLAAALLRPRVPHHQPHPGVDPALHRDLPRRAWHCRRPDQMRAPPEVSGSPHPALGSACAGARARLPADPALSWPRRPPACPSACRCDGQVQFAEVKLELRPFVPAVCPVPDVPGEPPLLPLQQLTRERCTCGASRRRSSRQLVLTQLSATAPHAPPPAGTIIPFANRCWNCPCQGSFPFVSLAPPVSGAPPRLPTRACLNRPPAAPCAPLAPPS